MADTNLSFKQRTCLFSEKYITPKFSLNAAFAAAFGQFANTPRVPRERWDEFPHRLEVYYAVRSTRDAGELVAGYLHHEDPRLRPSLAHGFWRRTDYSLRSVLKSPGDDGHDRIAYAPIVASFSSAVVASEMYRRQNNAQTTLIHAGLAYGHYMTRSFFHEFRPDINAYARHFLHRDN